MNIALAIAIVTVAGLLGSVILVLAAKFMAVEEDPRIGEVTSCLPGANCGACGYAGCADYAKAIVEGGAPVNKCVPGGAKAAADVAAVMGVEAGATAAVRATVRCQGKPGGCTQIFDYHGVSSCAAAAALYGGPKACAYGCLGLGDCVKACKFAAIHVVDGVAVVDKEACKACGKCIAVCPRHLIELVPYEQKHLVQCSSRDKGKDVMSVCSVGCIGCKMCEKVCEFDAVKVVDNIAHIDPSKCTNCGKCAEKCPKKVIL